MSKKKLETQNERRYLLKDSSGRRSITVTVTMITFYIFLFVCVGAFANMKFAENEIFMGFFKWCFGITVGAFVSRDLALKLKR